MPAPGDIDTSYPSILKEKLGIILLEPYKGAKLHHLMKCCDCGHEWSATPVSKLQNFKKYPNGKGCPACHNKTRHDKHSAVRMDNIKRIRNAGLDILTEDYDGKRGDIYFTIQVKHNVCNHVFDLRVANFLYRGLDITNSCKICGVKKRSELLTQTSIDRHIEWLKTATEWQIYKYQIELETKKTYLKNKQLLNPHSLKRGTGDNEYHLDQILFRGKNQLLYHLRE